MSEPLEIASLIQQLTALDTKKISTDHDERKRALKLCRKLTTELDGPLNRVTYMMYQAYQTVAVRVGADLNLYSHIVSAPGGSISTKELSRTTGAEEDFITRVLRFLAAVDFVEEKSEDEWSANEITKAMATAPIMAGYRFVFEMGLFPIIKAPKFLRETNYRSPTEPNDGLIQYTHQTKLDVFEYLNTEKLSILQDFNLFMGHAFGSHERWHQWYDIPGRIISGFDATQSGTLLVDIGGGKGHDLQAFVETFKSRDRGYEGDLVLQEQEQVIDSIPEGSLDPSIKKQAHDFFTPQPIKGARAYFFHHIFHNWADKYCRMILSHIKDAMKPGYSKLLIHDLILPNTGVEEVQARFDHVMMFYSGGAERSRSQWTRLLEDLGFQVEIHEHFGQDGIVEATLPA